MALFADFIMRRRWPFLLIQCVSEKAWRMSGVHWEPFKDGMLHEHLVLLCSSWCGISFGVFSQERGFWHLVHELDVSYLLWQIEQIFWIFLAQSQWKCTPSKIMHIFLNVAYCMCACLTILLKELVSLCFYTLYRCNCHIQLHIPMVNILLWLICRALIIEYSLMINLYSIDNRMIIFSAYE